MAVLGVASLSFTTANLHFEGLRLSPLAANQLPRLLRAVFAKIMFSGIVFAPVMHVVSSAYSAISSVGAAVIISLTYSTNRSGPRIEPWGTPISSGRKSDSIPLTAMKAGFIPATELN